MTLPEDPADRVLLDEVAPDDWPAPEPPPCYDLVVVGGGTAGLVSAAIAAGLGARVALVEEALLGGDCLNTGCVPSKALLSAAHRLHAARSLGDEAWAEGDFGGLRADFPAVMRRMRELRAAIAPHDGARRFRSLGVDVYLGRGRFTGPRFVEVELRDGTLKALCFKRAVVATGARALVPPIPGLVEAGCLTNETVFDLDLLPQRLLVGGAGPIGAELAQAFRRFGSEVEVVALDPRPLPREDPDAAAIVADVLAAEGVRWTLGAGIERVEGCERDKCLHWTRKEPSGTVVDSGTARGDTILLALGRVPNVDGLGLEDAGVRFTRRGVQVDEFLRTTNPRIFAAGDVVEGAWQFTHAADHMARLVVRNAFFFGRGRWRALPMSWCTFTDPEVAHVGLYAHQEDEAGCALEELRMDLAEVDRAILEGDTVGFAKVVVERKSGKLRGATVVGSHAGELLGEVLPAVARRLPLTALSSLVHPYPTRISVWGRLGDLANRRRLTPRTASLLRTLIRLRR